ncbi:MAG: universal stress protein [Ferruginibacter sp.]
MSLLLANILVPVDFSLNTEVAVKKAIELAQSTGSIIHLLHVSPKKNIWNHILNINNFSTLHKQDNYNIVVIQKLQEWQKVIKGYIPQTEVKICFSEGSVHYKILHVAKKLKPQLIIIAKKTGRKLFILPDSVNPNRLAKSSACPVLTILNGTMQNKIKTIVVPVRFFIPYLKIEWVIEFAKKDRAKIHIVTLQSKMASWNTDRNYLIETHRLIKSRLNNTVEYHVLNGTNLPRATLDYAKHIGADMILANPCSETKITSLTGKHMNDLLLASTKLEILSVVPKPDE